MRQLRKLFLILALICSAHGAFAAAHSTSAPSASAAHPFGLGILLGEPTAISGKYWFDSPYSAVDGGLGLSFDNSTLLFADYLRHFPGAFGRSSSFLEQTTPYIGVGPILAFNHGANSDSHNFFGHKNDSFGMGVRVPFGAEWLTPEVPLGAFLEIVPGIALFPDTSGIVEAGIGVRYYF